jgi:hypothetical protein
MFSRTRVHPVAAAAISGETNTDSNRGVLERGAPPREEEEYIFNEADYVDIPERSQDSQRLRQQENDIRQRENSLKRKLPKLKPEEIRRRQDSIKLLQDALNQQKENREKKRIQRKERIIAEMKAERAEMEAERLAEINRPPPSYYSSSPVQVPVQVSTVPVPAVPVPVVRRPWYHRLADRIDNADWNRTAPPSASQIARGQARRTRRGEAALRREERSEDELQKKYYEKQKKILKKWYLKHPNGTPKPDTEFPVYPLYHKTLNPEIKRIPKPYSYLNPDNKSKKKHNFLKRLLTRKNVLPRKKSPVPKNILMPPEYSPPKIKVRSPPPDYVAGGSRSSRKKTRKTKKIKRS